MSAIKLLLVVLCVCLVQAKNESLGEIHCYSEPTKLDCEHFNLTTDQLSSIQIPRSLLNVSKLTIDLGFNDLDDVPDAFIETFSRNNIFRLRLESNQFVTIPSSVLSLGKLTVLDLADNQIRLTRSLYFEQMKFLRKLELQYNRITELRNLVFEGLSELNVLYLNHNQISVIHPLAFKGLDHLDTLNLGSNKIQTIPAGMFKLLPEIASVDLDHNKLTEITDETFAGPESMLFFMLQGNQISTLSPKAFPFPVKYHLDLSNNQLSELPKNVFPECFFVYLANNSLKHFPSAAFAFPRDLYFLDLSGNSIESVREVNFADFPVLDSLYLGRNPLTTFPQIRNQYLNILGVEGTLFGHIYPCNLAALPNLVVLFWEDSPIVCDCSTVWLRRWFDRKMDVDYIEEYSFHWTCAAPPRLAGVSFHEVPIEDFVCDNDDLPLYCDVPTADVEFFPAEIESHGAVLNYSVHERSSGVAVSLQRTVLNSTHGRQVSKIHVQENPLVLSSLEPGTLYSLCLQLLDADQYLITENCTSFTTLQNANPSQDQRAAATKLPIVPGIVVCVLLVGLIGFGVYVFLRPPQWLVQRYLARMPAGGIVNSVYDASGDGNVEIFHESSDRNGFSAI